jgi:hypothetical protein
MRVLEQGPSIVPALVQKYPTMNYQQKVATVILLGELKKPEAMSVLIDGMVSGNDIVASFACRSAGKLQDMAVSPLLEALKTTPHEKKRYLIEGLGRTRQAEALTAILALCKEQYPTVRKTAVAALAYFGESKNTIEQLLASAIEADSSVGEEAVAVLHDIHSKQLLQKHATYFPLEVKRKFASLKEPEKRGRLIRVMGVAGLCTKESGENYIELFRDTVREAFRSQSIQEKIAAAYSLGRFRDDELIPELMKELDHENANLSHTIAIALNALVNPEIPKRLLEKKWTDRPHVLEATAHILYEYHIYVKRLEMEEQAIVFLLRSLSIASLDIMKTIAKSLHVYCQQPIEFLLFSAEDFKKPLDLTIKLQGNDPLSSYLRQKFSPKIQEILQKHIQSKTVSSDLSLALVQGFNQLLAIELYEKERFANVPLSKGTQSWLGQNLPKSRKIHLNRLLLEEAYATEISKLPLLNLGDFVDTAGLVLKLRSALPTQQETKTPPPKTEPGTEPRDSGEDRRDPLSRHIWYQLSPETQKLLNQYDPKSPPSEEMKISLMDHLNHFLTGEAVYEERLFKHIKLDKETKQLTLQKLQGRKLLSLHHRLLTQAYTKELTPLSKVATQETKGGK